MHKVCWKSTDLFFFAKTWWISMKCTCMRQPWTFIWLELIFSCRSIASVDGKQHLSEVVFSALVSDPDFMNTIVTGDESWVYRYNPETKSFQHFFLQWKSDETTKHYLTQMLLGINWHYWQAGKKCMHAYEGSRSAHASRLHWNPSGFRKRK